MKALMNHKLMITSLSIVLAACSFTSQQAQAAAVSKVNTDGIALSAPQYMMVSIPASFSLIEPSGVAASNVSWSFSDGSSAQGVFVNHALFDVGAHSVSVSATSSLGTAMTFTQAINVIPYSELLFCVSDLKLSAPAGGIVGTPVNVSVNIPSCVAGLQTGISWNFGDGSTAGSGTSQSHTYANPGEYAVYVTINYINNDVPSSFVLTTGISVEGVVVPPPTPDPDPTPTDPGHCALPAGALTGVGAISQRLIQIDGVYYLMNGEQMTFYSSQNPEDSCSSVAQTRKCENGVLSGSANYVYLMCTNPVPVPITYSWAATESYTACSADCGGTQSQIYDCRSSTGAVVANNMCAGATPVVTRLCDGNPAAVARTDVAVTEQSGDPGICPTGQVGTVTSKRSVTTKTSYACVDHKVDVASTSTVFGDWVVTTSCQPKPVDPKPPVPPTPPTDECKGDDGHRNDRGRGHHSHGNGHGYGHSKDCDPKPPTPPKDPCDHDHGHKGKDCDHHQHKDCDHSRGRHGRDCDRKPSSPPSSNHGGSKGKDCDKGGKSGAHKGGRHS